MFISLPRRSSGLFALACALAVTVLATPALAASSEMTSAQAQERYYASYSAPAPQTAAQAASDSNALLIIVVSVGGSLVAVAASVAGRRLINRRRHRVAA